MHACNVDMAMYGRVLSGKSQLAPEFFPILWSLMAGLTIIRSALSNALGRSSKNFSAGAPVKPARGEGGESLTMNGRANPIGPEFMRVTS